MNELDAEITLGMTKPKHHCENSEYGPETYKPQSAIQTYLKEISYHSLLTKTEEIQLGRLIQEGDYEAWKQLVESNLRLVVQIARRYGEKNCLTLLDIIEEGNLGLLHAAKKFDPERGYRFSTYATIWIREYIERAIMDKSRMIRLPIYIIKKLRATLNSNSDTEETKNEAQNHLNERVLPLNYSTDPNDKKNLEEVIADHETISIEDQCQSKEFEVMVHRWMNDLASPQREIVELYFGINPLGPLNNKEIGEIFGFSAQQASKIRKSALDELSQMAFQRDKFNLKEKYL
ncbi:sigma-70 family RNA polymerase sigma factor [Acidithiobacillus thiooxidans]|uniref:sigma-70 family RNA polymerase sigma factor n=1 Tax=Acidithiobacillus thiooxidans TaxID=930 RepID=UPI0029C5AD99|nr:sigma-70 family RNA polymerase sigma factor [Acidithiobacillus thiooxidans]MDX5933585.1 sigma-70 family RNA polymerase sigma factor [Acidithiobacillus thiooxidans]